MAIEDLSADQIKIGTLSDIIRKKVININADSCQRQFSITIDLRGIVFAEHQNTGIDIWHPELTYPIFQEENSIYKRTMGITEYTELAPLLQTYDMNKFSSEELQVFLRETVLSKEWINENMHRFVDFQKKYGPMSITHCTDLNYTDFPFELIDMICKAQETDCMRLTKREKKMHSILNK